MNKVSVERLTARPTLACNLKCRYCNEYSPQYESPILPALSKIKTDIDRTFRLIDYINIFEVSGGEPLLYKQLPQMLQHINLYNERYRFFSLVTNGSILMNGATLTALRIIGPKARVIVDDYGSELSKHARDNARLLAEAGIRYELRDQYVDIHEDGWLDFSDLSLKRDESAAKQLFAECVCPQKLRWVITLHNGKLYPCHVSRRCTELKIIQENPVECINIHDPALSDEELRENIMGLYSLEVLRACAYCSGFVSRRERMRPAEQLSKMATK